MENQLIIPREELVKGEVYRAKLGSGSLYIMLCNDDVEGRAYMYDNITNDNYFYKGGMFSSSIITFSASSPEEKQHMIECVKAGKFVKRNPLRHPKPTVNNEYSII